MSGSTDRVGAISDFYGKVLDGAKNNGKKPFNAEFGRKLKEALKEVEDLQENADKLSRELAMGESAPLHETMIALEKADISLRLFVEVRNKVVEAYREVMRMQF